MTTKNQSLHLANKAGPGKSVSARTSARPADQASRRVGVQAELYDARSARVIIEASISGGVSEWMPLGEMTFETDGDNFGVIDSEIPFTFVRARLLEDVEALVPVLVGAPEPIEHVEVEDFGNGASRITSVVETAATPPGPPFGVSVWLAGY